MFVRLFHPLWQIAEKDKGRDRSLFELGNILYLYIFPLVGGWWIVLDDGKHLFVEPCGRYMAMPVFVHLRRAFEYLVYALLGQGRSVHDGKVGKGSQSAAYGIFKSLDGLCALVFDEVPLVDAHHQPFFVFLYEGKDVEVLSFDAASGVDP